MPQSQIIGYSQSGASVLSFNPKGSRQSKPKHKKLTKKRNELRIWGEDSTDVTPLLLHPFEQFGKTDKRKSSMSNTDINRTKHAQTFGSVAGASTAVLQSQMQFVNMSYSAKTNFGTSSIKQDEDVLMENFKAGSLFKFSEEGAFEETTYFVDKISAMPVKMNIILTETPVFYLHEMVSETAEKDTDEGIQVEHDNQHYEYLTVGKGRNRKVTNAETQTAACLLKSRSTFAQRYKRRNNDAFASTWDMYDTFENLLDKPKSPSSRLTPVDPNEPDYPKYQQELNRHLIELLKNRKFQISLTVMERILANNVYNHEQKRFRGLVAQDPFRPDIEFKYRLELLWTFKNTYTEGHPVSTMHWNPSNNDMLAVGYGKFFYNENKHGFVYVWNIKNPTQPEREYSYKKPVTAVAFSSFDPNLLAVGLYDSQVNVLDISHKYVKVLYTTSPLWSPSHEPVWQVIWLPPDDYYPTEEYLVCITDEGRVCRLVMGNTTELQVNSLMRVIHVEGQIRGVPQPKPCPVSTVLISRCSAATVITSNRTDKNIYYLGTDEGTIHKCSRNYLNQHLSMFLAHNGPIYSCQFSMFCTKLFLTCGADWTINIWAESVTEPLITLTKSMEAIEGAAWNPNNSTIIANIAGSDIYIWDIQRRTYLPVSVHKSPTNCRNTMVQFTASGRNLVVSDIEGNVHIFSLEDMPFPPFYQAEMLEQVMKKTLTTRHDLLYQLDHTGAFVA